MERRKELGEFLRAKRGQMTTPEAVGSGRRRVPGLRREEVAERARISTIYYTKLEQGKVRGLSSAVLDGIARALALTAEERAYVATLIPVTGESHAPDIGSADDEVAPELARTIHALAGVPAHLFNERSDLILANPIGRALYPWHFEGDGPPNVVRFQFLDPRARTFYVEWEKWASQSVAFTRAALARHPADAELLAFVEEMRRLSPDFRRLWESHLVRIATRGVRRIVHPDVGPLDLDFQLLRASGHDRLRLITYSAGPGSPTHSALQHLNDSLG